MGSLEDIRGNYFDGVLGRNAEDGRVRWWKEGGGYWHGMSGRRRVPHYDVSRLLL